jgi:co-chaperonin GroES (HSP10)
MIKVFGYRVLVTPDKIQTKTESGLIIEYAGNEKLEKGARMTGTVVEVGPESWGMHKNKEIIPWCAPGDRIFWAKYAGKEIIDPEDNKEYVVLNDDDVICKVI